VTQSGVEVWVERVFVVSIAQHPLALPIDAASRMASDDLQRQNADVMANDAYQELLRTSNRDVCDILRATIQNTRRLLAQRTTNISSDLLLQHRTLDLRVCNSHRLVFPRLRRTLRCTCVVVWLFCRSPSMLVCDTGCWQSSHLLDAQYRDVAVS
jgi:hypothetical protein